ncbi:MAG: flagellin, partial [Campylobacterales bacterium]|nr:flagellin [Campylobacterales bacterium]
MRINTNVSSLTALEANTNTNYRLKNSLEKLSSGLRINKASDDASGLAIADKLRTQANGLNQAVANGNSGVTLTQIADKAMAEQSNILDIIKQKLIQQSTATTSLDGAKAIAKDIKKLIDQLDNIGDQTEYNGLMLLKANDASQKSSTQLKFQMGVN